MCSTSSVEAWQTLMDDYSLVPEDEDEDEATRPAGQTVEEEMCAYLTSMRAPKGTNLLEFWGVCGIIPLFV
jgi:hypothetical protein